MSLFVESKTSGAAQITIVGVGDWGCERLQGAHPDVRALAQLVAVHTDPLVLANCRADSLFCLEEVRARPEFSGVEDPHSGYARLQAVVTGSDLILVIGRADDAAQLELVSDVTRSCLPVAEIVVPVCPVSSVGELRLWSVDEFGHSRWPALKMILSIPDLIDADEVVATLCQSLCGIILTPSVIGVDYADVRLVLEEPGGAVVALEAASGIDRADQASRQLMNRASVTERLISALAVLVVITAGEDMTLQEFSIVGEWVSRYVSPSATVIIGVIYDKACDKTGLLKLTLVAAGLGERAGDTTFSKTL